MPKVQRAPARRDVILAAAVTAYGLLVTFVRIGDGTIYHGPRLPNAILSVLVTSTLAWRKTKPLLAVTWLFAVYAGTFAVVRHDLQLVAGFGVLIVLVVSGAYHTSRRDALACLAVGLASLAVLMPLEPQLGGWSGAVYDTAFVVLPWLAARALRSREDRAAALGAQLALTQASYEARQREILREERAQIARELHDIVTTFDLDHYVYQALKAGASGFLLKDEPPERLAAAVRTVAAGDALLAPALLRRLLDEYVSRPEPGQVTPPPELTEREVEVLQLIGRGRSNSEIAAELFLSQTTVKTHVTRIFTKLRLRDRAQAVVLAYETGLVTPHR